MHGWHAARTDAETHVILFDAASRAPQPMHASQSQLPTVADSAWTGGRVGSETLGGMITSSIELALRHELFFLVAIWSISSETAPLSAIGAIINISSAANIVRGTAPAGSAPSSLAHAVVRLHAWRGEWDRGQHRVTDALCHVNGECRPSQFLSGRVGHCDSLRYPFSLFSSSPPSLSMNMQYPSLLSV